MPTSHIRLILVHRDRSLTVSSSRLAFELAHQMRRDLRSPRPALVSLASTRVDHPPPTIARDKPTSTTARLTLAHTSLTPPTPPSVAVVHPPRSNAPPSSHPPIASPRRASRTRIFALLLPRSILSLADPSSTSTLDARAPMTTRADDDECGRHPPPPPPPPPGPSAVGRGPAASARGSRPVRCMDHTHPGVVVGRRPFRVGFVPCPCPCIYHIEYL